MIHYMKFLLSYDTTFVMKEVGIFELQQFLMSSVIIYLHRGVGSLDQNNKWPSILQKFGFFFTEIFCVFILMMFHQD